MVDHFPFLETLFWLGLQGRVIAEYFLLSLWEPLLNFSAGSSFQHEVFLGLTPQLCPSSPHSRPSLMHCLLPSQAFPEFLQPEDSWVSLLPPSGLSPDLQTIGANCLWHIYLYLKLDVSELKFTLLLVFRLSLSSTTIFQLSRTG